jgi:hypothetical protein
MLVTGCVVVASGGPFRRAEAQEEYLKGSTTMSILVDLVDMC